jgi:hypothetical protein
MFASYMALLIAGLFAGAAFYINFAEQPARLELDDDALLTQWKTAYRRGLLMQSTLVVVGFLFGVLAWYRSGRALFLIGAILLLANWPWTILVMLKINRKLGAILPENAGPETRALIEKWNVLHRVRTALGFLSALAFLFGLALH